MLCCSSGDGDTHLYAELKRLGGAFSCLAVLYGSALRRWDDMGRGKGI